MVREYAFAGDRYRVGKPVGIDDPGRHLFPTPDPAVRGRKRCGFVEDDRIAFVEIRRDGQLDRLCQHQVADIDVEGGAVFETIARLDIGVGQFALVHRGDLRGKAFLQGAGRDPQLVAFRVLDHAALGADHAARGLRRGDGHVDEGLGPLVDDRDPRRPRALRGDMAVGIDRRDTGVGGVEGGGRSVLVGDRLVVGPQQTDGFTRPPQPKRQRGGERGEAQQAQVIGRVALLPDLDDRDGRRLSAFGDQSGGAVVQPPDLPVLRQRRNARVAEAEGQVIRRQRNPGRAVGKAAAEAQR